MTNDRLAELKRIAEYDGAGSYLGEACAEIERLREAIEATLRSYRQNRDTLMHSQFWSARVGDLEALLKGKANA